MSAPSPKRTVLLVAIGAMALMGMYVGIRAWPPPPSYDFLRGHSPITRRSFSNLGVVQFICSWKGSNHGQLHELAERELSPLGFGRVGAPTELQSLMGPGGNTIVEISRARASGYRREGDDEFLEWEEDPNSVMVAILMPDPVPVWLRNLTRWP